jgi:hypothetical protein
MAKRGRPKKPKQPERVYWASGAGKSCGHWHLKMKEAVACAIARYCETQELLPEIRATGTAITPPRVLRRLTLEQIRTLIGGVDYD